LNTQKSNEKILIVGAGPVGLTMACLLADYGISFRIIDKRKKRNIHSGALIIQNRTLELLEPLGLSEKLMNAGMKAKMIQTYLNGNTGPALNLDLFAPKASKYPFLLLTEQCETEKILEHYLSAKGIKIERNVCLSGIIQKESVVEVTFDNTGVSSPPAIFNYVIGADGYNSAVRNILNIPFVGKTYELSLFVYDGGIDTKSLQEDTIHFAFSRKAVSGFFPLKNKRWRIDGSFPELSSGKEEINFKHVNDTFRVYSKMAVNLERKEWFSVFKTQQRYAKSFQEGNFFLIGDAAHIHSPIGAQGMNTGMQDAINLAWKLYYTLAKNAPRNLINTYTEERNPVARKVISATDIFFRLLASQSILIRILRLPFLRLLVPVAFLLIRKNKSLRDYVYRSISQTGIHYRKGPLTVSSYLKHGNRARLRSGDRFPLPAVLSEYARQETKHQLCILSSEQLPARFSSFLELNSSVIESFHVSGSIPAVELLAGFGLTAGDFLLVRPDGYIACIGAVTNFKVLKEYLDKLTNV
jgi:2-polyprenyl-6-methoxyphenol hydroxylase-like FAD-dependent oxidoreductase